PAAQTVRFSGPFPPLPRKPLSVVHGCPRSDAPCVIRLDTNETVTAAAARERTTGRRLRHRRCLSAHGNIKRKFLFTPTSRNLSSRN
ncbi:hypothetical protein RB213_008329, partial [Colletotrichum asianum]